MSLIVFIFLLVNKSKISPPLKIVPKKNTLNSCLIEIKASSCFRKLPNLKKYIYIYICEASDRRETDQQMVGFGLLMRFVDNRKNSNNIDLRQKFQHLSILQ